MASTFEKQLDTIRYAQCSNCGERKGHVITRGKGWLKARCKWCRNLREYTISQRKRNGKKNLTIRKPGGHGRSLFGPGLIGRKSSRRGKHQRRVLRMVRKRRSAGMMTDAEYKRLSKSARAARPHKKKLEGLFHELYGRNPQRRDFANDAKDILVRFNGEEFVIIGDQKKVSNKELLALAQDKLPKGWRRVYGPHVNPRPGDYAGFRKEKTRREIAHFVKLKPKSERRATLKALEGYVRPQSNPAQIANAAKRLFPPSKFRIRRVR